MTLNWYFFIFSITGIPLYTESIILKPHEMPWHNFTEKKTSHHACSLLYGDVNAPSRTIARRYIKSCGYTTMLDIPCGFCTEYAGLQQDEVPITYYGIDIAQELVRLGQQKGLTVIQGSIEQIPYPDSFVDLCYARHIFEHILSYEEALNELIRVADKEVLIIFSITPSAKPDLIKLWKNIYLNHYNKTAFEAVCLLNNKVHGLSWQPVNHRETILHIYLRSTEAKN